MGEMDVVKPEQTIQEAEVVAKAVETINVEKAKPKVLPKFFSNVFKPAAVSSVSKASTTASDVEKLVDEVEKKTLAEFDPTLDQEVTDALRLAEEALAELEKKEEKLGVTNEDIDSALLRAKVAAAQAKAYAIELEDIV